jgi:Cellulase (glycosyl hydrolase family 5)
VLVRRLVQFLLAVSLASLLVPAVATSATRMYVGFHDDPNFRYESNRQAVLDQARDANTTIVRTLVTWANIAPTRPENPADPFDPAYKFDDLDELVRNTQQRGMEVLITIWGTPKWANGGRKPNYLPTNMADLTTFARVVAERYSGRHEGYPFVRFYSVWNESNLQLFLAPQFDGKGRSVAPRNYARLYAAAYAGIKAGNSRAKVAIGETSAHGRDRKVPGVSDTHSPGRFAQLVAAANPRLKFDAWAHHPYPTPQSLKPTQKVRWPNVTLSSMARFEQALDGWFKRKGIRMWVTEYGHEVKTDGEPRGVTRSQQAAYAAQAISLAKADKRVDMFIWFVFRDHETSEWQSGLLTRDGIAKPSLGRWRSAAFSLDARNAIVNVRGGRMNPSVAVPLREYATSTNVGALVGITYRVFQNGRLVAIGQPATVLDNDAVARFALTGFRPAKKATYRVEVVANTANLDPVGRMLTLVCT